MKRIYNFSAGPGILPQDALDAASEAVIAVSYTHLTLPTNREV